MPAEKPLTADEIKPGVRVRGPGGNVFRIVRVADGTVAMALEDASPEWERGAAQMLEPLFSGVPRYTVVGPDPRDARVAALEKQVADLTAALANESDEQPMLRAALAGSDARIADLEREKAALERQVEESEAQQAKCHENCIAKERERVALASLVFEIERLLSERTAGLADAIGIATDMADFIENAGFDEREGQATLARLRKLLP